MNNIDWDLVRGFLTVAEYGSLSAAARKLNISQPSLSRHIQSLETTTGLNLFRRTTQGLELTEHGKSLVEAAQQMQHASDKFNRLASGLSTTLEGDVRISANEIIGRYLLPGALASFHQQHPGVQLEIVISNQASSLNKREADIALRMFKPEQPDLVARRLPDLPLGFYAHQDYLARKHAPIDFQTFLEHDIIGFDEDLSFIEGAAMMGFTMTRSSFSFRTDDLQTHFALINSGAGIGVLHKGIAEKNSGLVEVLREIQLPPLQFWCVCHSDVQYNSRIRETMRFLVDWFKQDPYHAVVALN